MQLTSSVFQQGQSIPAKYTCQGANVNPPLEFRQVPQEAKSLVLIVDDPDAPHKTWVHWLLWNMDCSAQIEEGREPKDAQGGINSWGRLGYGGPCPPSGTHRYFFKIYALDSKLSFDKDPTKEELEQAMSGHILARAELMGLYQKS